MREKSKIYSWESPIERFLNWVTTLEQSFLSNRFLNWIFKTNHPPYWAIDLFVFIDIVIALLLIFFVPPLSYSYIIYIPIGWATYRILEIVMFTIFALLTSHEDNIYHKGRMLALLILNYFEIILWFAFFYRILYSHFCSRGIPLTSFSFSESLYFSVVTMTTLGYGDITPNHFFTMILISIHTLIGLYLALIILGWFLQFFKGNNKTEGGKITNAEKKILDPSMKK